ncbi:MAG TPA: DMT family transporter [Solimonas sp.]|nr:DMT family transporter [Solimonas sp.]
MSIPAAQTTALPGAAPPMSALLDWTLLIGPGLIWGASFLFIAEGLDALAPDGITFLRFVIGFCTLACVPAARVAVRRSDWAAIAGLGFLWMALPMSMFPHAEQHVSSALTGMLNGSVPLVAALVAGIIERQFPSRGVLAGLAVGFTGIVLMALPGLGQGGGEASGIAMICFAMVCYGFGLNLARPLQQRNGALPVVWRALLVAMLLTAPLGAPHLLHAQWSWRPALCILALGALGTALANVLMAVAAGRIGATRASATTFLIPVVALVLGVAIRHEQVAGLALVGGALCLLGAWLMRRAALKGA